MKGVNVRKNLLVSIIVFIDEVTDSDFKIWTQVRLEEGPLYNLHEFPGGKIEEGESPKEAIIREVFEEVGVTLSSSTPIQLFKLQEYTSQDKNILLYVFISPFKNLPNAEGWQKVNYLDKSDYLKGKIPPINHVIVDELAVYIQKMHNLKLLDFLWKL
jgi:8-oxo-dGTP diphosphatase